ncbi:MAG: conserved hypothetical protein [Marine Group I thaumarchaeote]|nr:MAG: conserved hypothetical protein [Marine Group I thaumarchaeote]
MKINKKELEKKWKKFEQEQLKEQAHQLQMKQGYEQDEKFDESDD